MSTQWYKKHKDGRLEEVSIRPEDVDFSKPSLSLSIGKIERDFKYGFRDINNNLRFLPKSHDIISDYKAYDSCHITSGGYEYLHLVYENSGKLYYSRYNLTNNNWEITETEVLSGASGDYATVSRNNRVVVDVYDSGVVWVAYMSSDEKRICSCVSPDGGTTFSGFRTIKEQNNVNVVYYDNYSIPKVDKSSTGWAMLDYSSAYGGQMLRWSSSSTSDLGYYSFEVKAKDVYLYTYTTTREYSKNYPYVVNEVAVYIDGVHQKTINPNAKNGGYKTRYKLNSSPLSTDTTHLVQMWFKGGKYFFVDAIRVDSDPEEVYFALGDGIIRHRSGLTPSSGSPQEALVVYHDRTSNADPTTEKTVIVVDRSGGGRHWGNDNSVNYTVRSGYRCRVRANGRFVENSRGLWLCEATEKNSEYFISNRLFSGQTGNIANYGSDYWVNMLDESLGNDKPSNFSIASLTNSKLTMKYFVFESSEYTNSRYFPRVSVSPDLDLPGNRFDLSDELGCIFSLLNFTPAKESDVLGVVSVSYGSGEDSLYYSEVAMVGNFISIEDLSRYTYSLDIEHDNTTDPSTLRLSFSNYDGELSNRDEFAKFYSLLPKSFRDRSIRVVTVDIRFDMGSFYYQTRIFTGVLGEVDEQYINEGTYIDLSAYGFSKLLQMYSSPDYLVYANNTIDWSENANDYVAEIGYDGVSMLPPRGKYQKDISESESSEKKKIWVGWDKDLSWGVDSFSVDPTIGYIKQSGAGVLRSPYAGSYLGCTALAEFKVDDNTESVLVGFVEDIMLEPVKSYSIYTEIDFEGSSINLYASSTTVGTFLLMSKSITLNRDTYYRVQLDLDNAGRTLDVFVYTSIGENLVEKVHYKAPDYPNTDADRVAGRAFRYGPKKFMIGSNKNSGAIYWDNMFVLGLGESNKLKEDLYVAENLVSMAFQGFVNLNTPDDNVGEYFTTLVVHPGSDFKETLERLAAQNYKIWFFDYYGRFVWKKYDYVNDVFVLSDKDIEEASLRFDPLSYKNWVEVVDGEVSPKVRLSIGDVDSILRDGIRFMQHSDDSISNREQAKKVAYGKFYEEASGLEEVTINLVEPLVFIKPRDSVVLDSDLLGSFNTDDRVNRVFEVESVSINCDGPNIEMSLVLSSRMKALYERQAYIYNELGVVE